MRAAPAIVLVLTAAASCGPEALLDEASSALPQPPARAATPAPGPGVDLEAPVAVATAEAWSPARREVSPLDLGADRAPEAVRVPRPPPGGTVRFAFGEDRPGWVTRIPESQQLPAAAYGDGKLYISGGFASVSMYALDAERGDIVWVTPDLEDNGPTAAVYDDGCLIFNTESCTLFVLDARTGKRRWHRWLGDPTLAQTAVEDGLVYAAHPGETHGTYRLSAFTLDRGRRVWSRAIAGEALVAPVIHGDAVYVATLPGWTYRFERRSGARVWARRLNATSAPWLEGDRLHVGRRDGRGEQQAVFSAATGELLQAQLRSRVAALDDLPTDLRDWQTVWAFEGSRPVVHGGVKYVAMGGEVSAADAASGDPVWIRRNAAAPARRSLGTVAQAGAQVVVSSRDGELYGLDVDTGYTLWAYNLARKVVAEPVIAKGWVYLTTADGQVIGLKVADASLDGWHMFGGSPAHNGPPEGARH